MWHVSKTCMSWFWISSPFLASLSSSVFGETASHLRVQKNSNLSAALTLTRSPFLCRLWVLLSCFTRGRRCPGCVLEKTNLCCHPSGRREASCTITASLVSLPKKYQREFVGEYWQMTWDWWVTHTHLTAHIFTLLWSQQIWMNTRTPVCVFQGKTLTTIALILTNFHKGKPLPVEKCVSVAVYECVFCNRVTCLHEIVCLHVCRRSSLHLSKSKLNHRWPPIWKVLSTFTKLAGCRFEHGHSCMPENRNRALTGEVMWRLNFSKHQCRRQSSGDWCSSWFFMLRPVSVISLNLACSDYIVSDVGFCFFIITA